MDRIVDRQTQIEAYTVKETIDRVDDLLSRAEDRILMQVMHIDWSDPVWERFFYSISEAKSICPSLDVQIFVSDMGFTKHVNDKIHNQRMAELQDMGINITKVRHDSIEKFTGHNHIKALIIEGIRDDKVKSIAAFGGMNFDQSFINTCWDTWVFSDDPEMIRQVERLILRTGNAHRAFRVSEDIAIYYDSGRWMTSPILEKIKRVCNDPTVREIFYMSQLPPDLVLSKVLNVRAEEGVKINVVTHEPETFKGLPYKIVGHIYQQVSRLLFKNPNIKINIDPEKFVHAKILLVRKEVSPGVMEWEMMYGSHNMVGVGMMLGTKEMMIHTKNVELINAIMKLIRSRYRELLTNTDN